MDTDVMTHLAEIKIQIALLERAIANDGKASGGVAISSMEQRVWDAVCHRYGVLKKTLIGPSRVQRVAFARRMLIYMLREHSHLSFAMIGNMLNRNHTTILACYQKQCRDIVGSGNAREEVEYLKETILR